VDTDRNLLFGVLALQADLIDADRFARACALWAADKTRPLADVLVEQGWLAPDDRADVSKLLERKLKKHGGDAKASLAEAATDRVRQSLAAVADPDVASTLAGLTLTPPPAGHVLVATTDYAPEARDRYTLSRLHATGGIGRVWLARDASLGRDVALKELRPERADNPAVWGRFLREAQVTGQLEHPGIVPIYEVGRRPADQAPFYTMRFVRGRTLAEAAAAYHRRRQAGEAGPLELRELLTAVVGVCHAVAYAHSRGVLHRDLKPQNVVLGDFGEVIVLDWGLAKVLASGTREGAEFPGDGPAVAVTGEGSQDETIAGQVLGTPAYMAPEQAEGRLDRLDARTDVYGLGAVLYEVLTGRGPFAGEDTQAVLRRVIHDPPDRPRAVVPGTPAALEAVCLKALAKSPADRYPSAKAVADELRHWLADEPVAAYREPVAKRVGRWARRHRPLVAGAAAALVAAVVGLAVVLAVQARANTVLRDKNAELAAAEGRERVAREQAEANFRLAQDAVDQYANRVKDNPLLRERGMQPLRDELLRTALTFYQRLVRERGDDPALRADLADAYHRVATVTQAIGSQDEAAAAGDQAVVTLEHLAAASWSPRHRLDLAKAYHLSALIRDTAGRHPEARDLYRKAVGLLEPLVRDDPANADARKQLASTHNNLGTLKGVTAEEGQRLLREAIAHREHLCRDRPGDPTAMAELAAPVHNLGSILEALGRPDEARETYARALGIEEEVLKARPGDIDAAKALAQTVNNLGTLHHRAKRFSEALPFYERSVAIREELTRDNPRVAEFQQDLGRSYNNLAILHDNRGAADAVRLHQRAIDVRVRLVNDHPRVPEYRAELADSHGSLGQLQARAGRHDDALRSFESARDLRAQLAREFPDDSRYQSLVARSQHNLGMLLQLMKRHDPAREAFERARDLRVRLAREHPADPTYPRELAGTCVGLAETLVALGRPDEAVGVLRSVAADPGEVLRRIKTPVALAPLRERVDYKALVEELEEKAKNK
jgi:serine/threonine-protein kinase